MKLGVFIPSLEGGGAERVTVTLVNALVERGYSVDLVMSAAQGIYIKDLHPKVRVLNLNKKRVLFCILPLAKYLRNAKPDALLSVLNHANVVALAARALSGLNTRILVAEHNNLARAVKEDSSLSNKILTTLMRFTYPMADQVVACSDGVADSLTSVIGLDKSKIVVVYNPVVSEKVLQLSREIVRDDFFQKDGKKLVAVGRLTAQKDFFTLLKAFAEVRKVENVYLVILGEGELRLELEEYCAKLNLGDYVFMPGFVDNPYAWMASADLFVLSSAWEGLPTVLIEAMACGVNVVSTDCPSGPSEILQQQKWGALVPVGDYKAMSAAIVNSLGEPHKFKVRERAMLFNVENSINSYIKLFGG
jgi:glycosyltransferase involved in cell wall biosynthesis